MLNSTTYSKRPVAQWLGVLRSFARDGLPVIASVHADTPGTRRPGGTGAGNRLPRPRTGHLLPQRGDRPARRQPRPGLLVHRRGTGQHHAADLRQAGHRRGA
ncbi:hypothetical protein NKH77_15570 [Streptomyces sp. M19]